MKPDVCLSDFATTKTRNLLCYNIDSAFLYLPPQEWPASEQYWYSQSRFKSLLRIVNDTAERAVKLFEEYNTLLTNVEEEKQLLLQVVEANRKAVPTQITKKSAVQALMSEWQ